MSHQENAFFDRRALNEFYAQVSAEEGMKIADFQQELGSLFERSRSAEDLKDYRLSKGPWKKLADEIVPVSSYLRCTGLELGRIRFPLDNNVPDSWLWQDGRRNPVGIEVTIAQAAERFHLATELVNKGIGRGFIGISDDAPRREFNQAMAKERAAYTADRVLSAVGSGILRSLARKNNAKFAGYVLLIQAPLLSLPRERWSALFDELCATAAPLPFQEVFVVSNGYERQWGFQIK